jgi:hypothetical protein
MSGLFSLSVGRARKPAPRLPSASVDRSPTGRICDARCMFAVGVDCDCWCMGRNHQRGGPVLACDDPQQALEL